MYVPLLFLSAIALAYTLFIAQYLYAFALSIFSAFCLISYISSQKRLLKRIAEFAESVHYRDFTRRYPVRSSGPSMERKMNKAFNQLNEVYMKISSDKELQHQYLTKVINMLGAAMLFYHAPSGKVEWINEAFKELFQLPHLGNIRGLEKRNKDLFAITLQLKNGSQQVQTLPSSRGHVKLFIQMSAFETQGGLYKVVVYQDISEALDETENKAWHKLLRVLTHEIMNSIAPISSLAETLQSRFDTGNSEELKIGIDTIKRRSEGLLNFAKSYRMINQVAKPDFTEQSVAQLFETIYTLLEPTLQQKGIELDIILKNTRLVLFADPTLIEQVLINLLLNGIQAVKGVPEPYLSLAAGEQGGRVQIKVSDNGRGIPPDLLEQIFTPFFTTNKTGSGIGLTLCKQIMLLHQGSILVDTEEGKGSTFTLVF